MITLTGTMLLARKFFGSVAAGLLLCSTCLASFDDPEINYVLELKPGPVIEVNIEFTAGDSPTTELALSKEWGGIKNDGSDVNRLVVTQHDGQECAIDRSSDTSWTVHHAPSARLVVVYRIDPTVERPPVQGQNDYRTQLRSNLFQTIGNLGLLMPQHIDSERLTQFRISFKGFEPAGWKVVSSYGSGQGPFDLHWTRDRFLHATVMAGDVEVVERQVGKNCVAVAVAGSQWSFRPDRLADCLEQIVLAERDFFQDHSDPWYVVTLTPVRLDHPGSHSFGGTALTNCFALYCTPNLGLEENSPDYQRTKILLAHEYFHNWNGIKIPTASDDPSTYWFSEGFTNFYARRILFRAGLLTGRQWADDLNSALAAYQDNEYREAPNAMIADAFWTNRQVSDLPYQRGDLLATLLDEHIRIRSGGQHTLDDLMLDLFRNPIVERPVTTDVLLTRIAAWVDEDVLEQIRRSVIEGAEVLLPDQISEPMATLSTVQTRSYDPGFDIEKTREAKHLVGVVQFSEAWKAGLRDGQVLKGVSIQTGGEQPSAEVTLLVDGQANVIRYVPLGATKEIRIYQLNH